MKLTNYKLILAISLFSICSSCMSHNDNRKIYYLDTSTEKLNLSDQESEVLPSVENMAPCIVILQKGDSIFTNKNLIIELEDLMKVEKEIDVFHTYSYGYCRYAKFKLEK